MQGFPLPPELFLEIIHILRSDPKKLALEWLTSLRLVCRNWNRIVIRNILHDLHSSKRSESLDHLNELLKLECREREWEDSEEQQEEETSDKGGTRRAGDLVHYLTFFSAPKSHPTEAEKDDDRMLECLKRVAKNLECLVISASYQSPNITFPALSKLSKLSLSLETHSLGDRFADQGSEYAFLSNLPTLKDLSLRHFSFNDHWSFSSSDSFTTSSLAATTTSTTFRLKSLKLMQCKYTLLAYQRMFTASHPTLESLMLQNVIIKDGDTSHLVYPFSSNLQSLKLDTTTYGSKDGWQPVQFPVLHTLFFLKEEPSEEGLKFLQAATPFLALRRLSFRILQHTTGSLANAFSNNSLSPLPFSGLEMIDISGIFVGESDLDLIFDSSRNTLLEITLRCDSLHLPLRGRFPKVQKLVFAPIDLLLQQDDTSSTTDSTDLLRDLPSSFPSLRWLTVINRVGRFANREYPPSLQALKVDFRIRKKMNEALPALVEILTAIDRDNICGGALAGLKTIHIEPWDISSESEKGFLELIEMVGLREFCMAKEIDFVMHGMKELPY